MKHVMAKASRDGQITAYMMVNGKMAKQMDLALSIMLMETSMKGSGLRIKRMERASILMQMVPSTSEIGWMINSMGLELKNGQMVRFMKDITLKEKNME